ncbi:anhydro-N-acetylmuramic acid kinase [Glaesserella sp.]|uniref:anhydro-N-acetylmuramic acid kinase n=1 Tax=Glaesserella sp. TaxID=2094731 RepID=UPI00359F1464
MSEPNYYIGVMSGTSLDGVDIALVDFAKHPPKLTACDFVPMPESLRVALSQLLKTGSTNLQQLGELDHQLGILYADCVNAFLAKQQLTATQIRAIGCHGQTVWHSPQGQYPFTMQIGDMNLVAVKTGITTIGDFRRKDMAYGGQGAPLVPAFHQALFSSPNRITGVLNIGGISNISQLVPNQVTIGYDIGAGNTLLDIWIEKHQGKRFDKDAEWAKTGSVNHALLNELLNEPFFAKAPPKSTGRELFNLAWLEKKLQPFAELAAQDVQATLVEFTAQSIVDALNRINNPQQLPCLLLVCGGGARNPLLMSRLATLLPYWQVSTTTEYGLDVDYVEAAAFAWLAYQRLNDLPSNLPGVTGATQAVSLGVIFTK